MGEPAPRRWTYAEYLAHERASEGKHEFLDGRILAMAGGSRDHGLLAANTIGALVAGLRDRPCRVYSSDVRLRIPETGLATYPDLSVVCAEPEPHPEDADAVTNPILLVEVLSETTERRDRGEKLAHYETLQSLHHYLLVVHDKVRIEHFHREDGGTWTWRSYGPGERIALDGIDCTLAVDEVYAKTELRAGG